MRSSEKPRPAGRLGCPFCGGPTLTAMPEAQGAHEACADHDCDGAHGWWWAPEVTFADVARAYDVPPWLVDPATAPPRCPRLRWRLRRVWPL